MIEFELNGSPQRLELQPSMRLLDLLRQVLGLTGTKEGCGAGECGACTVLLNGEAVNSCLVPVAHLQGAQIKSVEGLEEGGRLAPVQRTYLQKGGSQCGICTPGFLLSTEALLAEQPQPSREEIRLALAGNLCRCTGYQKIIDAVEALCPEEEGA